MIVHAAISQTTTSLAVSFSHYMDHCKSSLFLRETGHSAACEDCCDVKSANA